MVKIHRKIFSAATITLLLWLNGFDCAMCCGKDAAEAHCNHEAIAAAPQNSSANAKLESAIVCQKPPSEKAELDCCKRSVSENSESVNSSSTDQSKSAASSDEPSLQISRQGNAVACSLLPKPLPGLTVAPKSFVNPDAQAASSASILAVVAPGSATPFLPRALPQNRSGTYLRCCVFLI